MAKTDHKQTNSELEKLRTLVAELEARGAHHKETEATLLDYQRQLEARNTELLRLTRAVEQSANAVVITDLEGKIEYVNPKFEEITGYAADEAIGHKANLVKSGEHDDKFYKALWEAISSGQEWQGEFRNKRKDGTLFWEQATISPVYNAAGEMTHYVAVKEDVSARKEAERALTMLLDLSQVLMASRDMDAALTQTVHSAAEIVSAADRGTLQWLDSDGNVLQTVAFSDGSAAEKDVPPFQPSVGVAGHALASKQIINVPDVRQDERFVPGDPAICFRSLLVAPLVIKNRAAGTLSLSSKKLDAFSTRDETLIGLIADQIAAALENAIELNARHQAEEISQRYTERLQIQHEIDQSILAARLPETVAVAAIRRIRQLIPCQRALVMAIAEDQPVQLLAAESSSGVEPVADPSIYQEMFEKENLGRGWVQGAEDLASLTQPSTLHQSLHKVGMRSYVMAPLYIQKELVGSLNLESNKPKAFTPDHIDIATEVAASLAVALRQARLYALAQQEISQRPQAEKGLRRYTVELEARNAEPNAYAHTVAHDLKNPLSSLAGYSQVLRDKYATLPDELAQKFINTIDQNARKMTTIVDELLLLASVREMEDIETQPLDMARLVAEARGRLLLQIEELDGEIILPKSWPIAIGYGPWVEAVWANYISNALKYGGRPPRVELGASRMKQKETGEPQVLFWVRDNGPGLSPEAQARLFTPFERLHQERVTGHGLGLSIVQRIAQKLGGQVGVESEEAPGKGSLFFFTLPVLPVDEKRP